MQPVWSPVGNLGDADPLENGGYFVYRDLTEVYPEEAEHLAVNENGPRIVHRFILDRCTFVDGVLSDNPYHPDQPAWFAKEIDDVANCTGITSADLIAQFCSIDPLERARAFRAIGEYFGFGELDSYPLSLTPQEAANRYAEYR